jgi:Zn-finger protein
VTAEAQPEVQLPDPATLWPCQISQTHCALCRRPLVEILDDRPIGEVEVGEGIRKRMAELWACAPTCATATPRRKGTSA